MEKHFEELKKIVDEFATKNNLEISFGKLGTNGKVSITILEKSDIEDEHITARDVNRFKQANEKHNLEELGIELGMIVNGHGSETPRSKTKVSCDYKIVGAVPTSSDKVIECLRMDNQKIVKFSIEDVLFFINNPVTEDDVKLLNKTHIRATDGSLVEVKEPVKVVISRKKKV